MKMVTILPAELYNRHRCCHHIDNRPNELIFRLRCAQAMQVACGPQHIRII